MHDPTSELLMGSDIPRVLHRGSEHRGLMICRNAAINPHDFRGSVVKNGSFVHTGEHIVKALNQDGIAVSERIGSEKWKSARAVFLTQKELVLRKRHKYLAQSMPDDCMALMKDLESIDWASILTGSSASCTELLIIRVVILLGSLRSSLQKVVQPLQPWRGLAVRTVSATKGSIVSIELPPPMGESLAVVMQWVEDLLLYANSVAEQIHSQMKALQDIMELLEKIMLNPSVDPKVNHENDWSTYMVRRTSWQAIAVAEEQFATLRDVVTALLVGNSCTDSSETRLLSVSPDANIRHALPEMWNRVADSVLFKRHLDDFSVLNSIVRLLQPIIFSPNTPLVKQGTLAADMYFLSSGSCRVKVGESTIASRQGGDVVGEIALINTCERTADVVADDHMEAFRLTRRDFSNVCKQYPVLRQRLIDLGAQRIKSQGWKLSFQKSEHLFHTVDENCSLDCAAGDSVEDSLPEFEKIDNIWKERFIAAGLRAKAGDVADLSTIWRSVRAAMNGRVFSTGERVTVKGDRTHGLLFILRGSLRDSDDDTASTITPGHLLGLEGVLQLGYCCRNLCAGPEGAEVLQLTRQDLLALCEMYVEIQPILEERLLEASLRD